MNANTASDDEDTECSKLISGSLRGGRCQVTSGGRVTLLFPSKCEEEEEVMMIGMTMIFI